MNSQAKTPIPPEMDYRAYAPHFDSLCSINPAYRDLLDLFKIELVEMALPIDPAVVDLGAGTGNFVCSLLEQIPAAHVTHVDSSPDMNNIAQDKYHEAGYSVNIVESFMQTVDIKPNSQDLIICVNSLNNAPPARPMLSNIYSWLNPGGYFFLIDFGREINVIDWTWFLVKHLLKTRGIAETISQIRRQAKVISINKKGKTDQQRGTLWTHSTDELVMMLEDTGFDTKTRKLCYRDYADLVVARRPLSAEILTRSNI